MTAATHRELANFVWSLALLKEVTV